MAYLAIEERPNSYVPIDILLLDIFNTYKSQFKGEISTNDLLSIDSFLAAYTPEEVRQSISRANIIDTSVINEPFVIIDKKHKLEPLFKDPSNECDFYQIVLLSTEDKSFANTLKNKLINIIKSLGKNKEYNYKEFYINNLLENLKDAFSYQDDKIIYDIISILPYEYKRELYVYFYKSKEFKMTKQLLREKKQSIGE